MTVSLFALYILVGLIYLFWIHRVHVDLNNLYLRYPRSPGNAVACMIVPFYSLYGITSTYRIMGDVFREQESTRRVGQTIRAWAVPLLLVIYIANATSRGLAKLEGDTYLTVLVISDAIDVFSYMIFLLLCVRVTQGLARRRGAEALIPSQLEPDVELDESAMTL